MAESSLSGVPTRVLVSSILGMRPGRFASKAGQRTVYERAVKQMSDLSNYTVGSVRRVKGGVLRREIARQVARG
jgi:hypothetical protein